MKICDLTPEMRHLPYKELLKVIDRNHFHVLLPKIAEYYDSRLSYRLILESFGVHFRGEGEQNVNCVLYEHGSTDTHASGKYYTLDRNTGLAKESTYCYKCQKALTAFWFSFKMLKDFQGFTLLQTIDWLESQFHVPFPVDIILDFDPQIQYQMDGNIVSGSMDRIRIANTIRKQLQGNPDTHIAAILAEYYAVREDVH